MNCTTPLKIKNQETSTIKLETKKFIKHSIHTIQIKIYQSFLQGGRGFDTPLAFIGDVLVTTDEAAGFLGEPFDDAPPPVVVGFEDAAALLSEPLCEVVEGPGFAGEPFA